MHRIFSHWRRTVGTEPSPSGSPDPVARSNADAFVPDTSAGASVDRPDGSRLGAPTAAGVGLEGPIANEAVKYAGMAEDGLSLLSPRRWSDLTGPVADAIGYSRAPDWAARAGFAVHDSVEALASRPPGPLARIAASDGLQAAGFVVDGVKGYLDARERGVDPATAQADAYATALIGTLRGPISDGVNLASNAIKEVAGEDATVTKAAELVVSADPFNAMEGGVTYLLDNIGALAQGDVELVAKHVEQALAGKYPGPIQGAAMFGDDSGAWFAGTAVGKALWEKAVGLPQGRILPPEGIAEVSAKVVRAYEAERQATGRALELGLPDHLTDALVGWPEYANLQTLPESAALPSQAPSLGHTDVPMPQEFAELLERESIPDAYLHPEQAPDLDLVDADTGRLLPDGESVAASMAPPALQESLPDESFDVSTASPHDREEFLVQESLPEGDADPLQALNHSLEETEAGQSLLPGHVARESVAQQSLPEEELPEGEELPDAGYRAGDKGFDSVPAADHVGDGDDRYYDADDPGYDDDLDYGDGDDDEGEGWSPSHRSKGGRT